MGDEQVQNEWDMLVIAQEGPVCSIDAARKNNKHDYCQVQKRAYLNNAFRYNPSGHASR